MQYYSSRNYVELDTYEAPSGAKPTEVKAKPKAKVVIPEPEDYGDLPF
jgi:hypothetical protein